MIEEELTPISINELKALSFPKCWVFEIYLDKLPSISPIEGTIKVEIIESLLNVKGEIEAKIKLNCDRCMDEYIEILKCKTSEKIMVNKDLEDLDSLNSSHSYNDLVDFIDPEGEFDPNNWVFEQLSLQIPILKICGKDCRGPLIRKEKGDFNQNPNQSNLQTKLDPRWSPLKKLLKQ
tara:strand:+ start:44 stop:577 length:534 start_codon:yes stop_codon:yes gene_type:complete